MMIAASATLDFVVVVIPPSLPHRASNSCAEQQQEKEKKGLLIMFIFFFFSFPEQFFFIFHFVFFLFSSFHLPPKPKSFRPHRCRSDRITATAIWTVCLSSIINIRACDARGGREFDGDGWRRLF
jgi:hypothetical protein